MLRKLNLSFVPKHNPVSEIDIKALTSFINEKQRILVLTGAGISTESGIPDYRSEGIGLFAQNGTKPTQFQEFVKKKEVRQRYWARNYVAWPRFSSIQPNYTHNFLKEMEKTKVSYIITQNVDNLHFKAGSKKVIELHGTSFRVMCLSCPYTIDRYLFQQKLEEINLFSNIVLPVNLVRPDGDIDLPKDIVDRFTVPSCPKCGSILKPDVVFFGDNVSKHVVNLVEKEVFNCDSVLVLGSTLATYSAYKIILQAEKLKKEIVIVNIGNTRADDHAHLKINAKCSDILSKVEPRLNLTLNHQVL
uniref:Deacetylase sirtuin-type domain-containing protein n=1 Tax=Clastoptera arizonana TaxID=38151 RepID=A0A1B6BZS2_9HEMI